MCGRAEQAQRSAAISQELTTEAGGAAHTARTAHTARAARTAHTAQTAQTARTARTTRTAHTARTARTARTGGVVAPFWRFPGCSAVRIRARGRG